jgi:hypothetical protein
MEPLAQLFSDGLSLVAVYELHEQGREYDRNSGALVECVVRIHITDILRIHAKSARDKCSK